ncbi:MAG: hypothetical protein N2109_06235 [Fimbriimonadales bacterium]|nr:hypothetical protein [Fimbriimonadales bacterium]
MEAKIRRELEEARRATDSRMGKVRRLLRLSRKTRALAEHLADLGFQEFHRQRPSRSRRFWSSAANLLALADVARLLARRELSVRR